MRTCTRCGESKPLEDFYCRADNLEGRATECKVCSSARNIRWREKNEEHCKEYDHTRYANNAEQSKEATRKWNKENKDKKAANAKRWKLLNPEKVKASSINYYEKHKKQRQVYERAWRQANADKLRERDHRRRAIKNNADGSFTKKEFSELCIKHGNICVCCGEEKKMTIDHIVPLSKGGSNSIDNIQPLCLSCNSKKYVHTVDYRNMQISFA